jgi:hypothetical protein
MGILGLLVPTPASLRKEGRKEKIEEHTPVIYIEYFEGVWLNIFLSFHARCFRRGAPTTKIDRGLTECLYEDRPSRIPSIIDITDGSFFGGSL